MPVLVDNRTNVIKRYNLGNDNTEVNSVFPKADALPSFVLYATVTGGSVPGNSENLPTMDFEFLLLNLFAFLQIPGISCDRPGTIRRIICQNKITF